MKKVKIILAIITMLFAVLGLVRILPFHIANPVMFVSLATFLLVSSVEYKKNRDKWRGSIIYMLEVLEKHRNWQ